MDTHSIDDLKKKYDQFLKRTEASVNANPEVFDEIRKILVRVIHGNVDIDEYNAIVTRLTELIEKMGTDTLFYTYFYDNIHPQKAGCVRYFRFICKDLLVQLEDFKNWRIQNRKLAIIK